MAGTTAQPSYKPPTHKEKKYQWRKNHREGEGKRKLAEKTLVAKQRCWKKTPHPTELVKGLVNYRACSHLPQTTPMNCIYSKNRLLFSSRHEKVAITFKTQIKLNLLPRRSHEKNDVDEYIVKESLICDHTWKQKELLPFLMDTGRFVTQVNDLTQYSFAHRHLRLLRYLTRHQRLLKKPWRLMAATVEPTSLPHQVIKLKKCADDL